MSRVVEDETTDIDDCESIGTSDTSLEGDFEVESILAARRRGGVPYYLIKWQDYKLDYCTREPPSSILSRKTLKDWVKKRESIRRGEISGVDVGYIEDLMQRCIDERPLRVERRARRRAKLAAPKADVGHRTSSHRAQTKQPTLPIQHQGDGSARCSGGIATSVSIGEPQQKKRRLQKGRPPRVADFDESEGELSHAAPSSPNSASDVQTHITVPTAPMLVAPETADAGTELMGTAIDEDSVMSDGSLFGDTIEENLRGGHDQDVNQPTGPVSPPDTSGETRSPLMTHQTGFNSPARLLQHSKTTTGISMHAGPAKRRHFKQVDLNTASNPEGKEFHTMKGQSIWHKAARSERPPDANALQLIDPKTGKLSRASVDTQVVQEAPRSLRTSPLEPNPEVTTTLFPADNQPVARRETTEALQSTMKEPIFDVRTSPPWIKNNVACRRWLRQGNCRFNDECNFAHHWCLKIEPKCDETCQFWAANGWSNDDLFEPAQCMVRMTVDRGGSSQDMAVTITLAGSSNLELLVPSSESGFCINLTSTCFAADLETYRELDWCISHEGYVRSDDGHEGGSVFRALHSYLGDYQCGVAGMINDRIMILHSTGDASWTSLHKSLMKPDIDCLHMIVLQGPSMPMHLSCTEDASSPTAVTTRQSIESTLNLHMSKLLLLASGSTIQRVFYLMFPVDLDAETDLLKRWLEHHKCTVFTTPAEGSWRRFFDITIGEKEKTVGGCVLWHPSVTNFWEVWNLHITTHRSGFNHFRMDWDAGNSRYHYTRLFPGGSATLITDEVFVKEPAAALKAVKSHYIRSKEGKDRLEDSRLYVRPDVLDMVAHLRQEADRQGDKHKTSQYLLLGSVLMDLLYPWARAEIDTDDDIHVDHDGDEVRAAKGLVVSPSLHDFADYQKMSLRHPKRATSSLVRLFCDWALDQIENLRRFYVILPSKYVEVEGKSSSEEGEIFTPTSPFTPRTPRESTDKPGHVRQRGGEPSVADPRIKKWQDKHRHVWFLTAERYLVDMEKNVKR
ncbi:hypothetical protein CAC42_3748 [Sphaceloma murrayae]|uniref:C3H1-type domain-containing protein n=1 Tax=Sphaceloma murrayae TaxID=2082308 RepID=A0A2K1QHV2_9PEZI|nr:hypothetical protein CAC42_3748 [Sphaceloma murrayae]